MLWRHLLTPFVAAVLMLTAAPVQAEISAFDQVEQMGPGVNMMGGYDKWWENGPSDFKDEWFKATADAGFTHVRIPLFTFRHLREDGTLAPDFLAKIDHVIGLAKQNGLTVILDVHDFDICAADTDACAVLLANVWYELSIRYRNEPDTVIFELLNEPHSAITADLWNAWLVDLIAIVRETNPTRNLIVGPVGWNHRDQLSTLVLPDDPHLIVTFHYYDPFGFTHQGASWASPEIERLSGIRWTGTAAEVAAIKADFDKVAAWSEANNRPIYLGEYGAYDRYGLMEDRAAWTKAVSKAADEHGFGRAYWYFNDGFGVYNHREGKWVQPLLDALMYHRAE